MKLTPPSLIPYIIYILKQLFIFASYLFLGVMWPTTLLQISLTPSIMTVVAPRITCYLCC